MAGTIETLFEVDGRVIEQDSIHPLKLGQSGITRMMAIDYDEVEVRSVWVCPGTSSPIFIMLNPRFFEEEIGASGKPYLSFRGNHGLMANMNKGSLTPTQREKYDNWNQACEEAGYGGSEI